MSEIVKWRIYTPNDYAGPDSLPGLGIETEDGDAVVWFSESPYNGIADDKFAPIIAAAPELLEANVSFVEAIDSLYNIKPDWDDDRICDELPSTGLAIAYLDARAAIAKAARHD